jgi:hypothetical protein
MRSGTVSDTSKDTDVRAPGASGCVRPMRSAAQFTDGASAVPPSNRETRTGDGEPGPPQPSAPLPHRRTYTSRNAGPVPVWVNEIRSLPVQFVPVASERNATS